MADPRNYVNGKVDAPQMYELRINGAMIEQSANMPGLCWKARRAVDGTDSHATVEAISGFGFSAIFSDALLHDWERVRNNPGML